MMERKYSKDSKNAKQIITTQIQADQETVFHFLATTAGISTWFPQLSIKEEAVLFDMGDGTFEKMALIDYTTNEHIAYEWATGKVEFQLEKTDNGTKLTLTETLPLNFTALAEDFTGWFVQMKNVKAVSETKKPAKIPQGEIKTVKAEIEEALSE
jgi:uncharacterized protein YndB with AHSA1/START domain